MCVCMNTFSPRHHIAQLLSGAHAQLSPGRSYRHDVIGVQTYRAEYLGDVARLTKSILEKGRTALDNLRNCVANHVLQGTLAEDSGQEPVAHDVPASSSGAPPQATPPADQGG